MLVGVQQHPSFSTQTYFDYETFYLVQCFSTVFGIRPISKIHRGMWPCYTFSRFRELFFAFIVGFKSFLAFCPFSKCTKACNPFKPFSRFHERFWHFAIFEIHRGMWSCHIFSRFHERPQKSYQRKFQKCCPTKIRKNKSRKSFPLQQLKED